MSEGPMYVPFPGEPTLRAPGTFHDIQFYYFLIEADPARLDALCERFLRLDPSSERTYSAFSKYVVVAWSDVAKLSSADPSNGAVAYKDIAIWVPIRVVEKKKQSWFPKVVLLPSYIFVDDPQTLVTGREVYGFPKQAGRFQMPSSPDDMLRAPFITEVMAAQSHGDIYAFKPLFEVRPRPAKPGVFSWIKRHIIPPDAIALVGAILGLRATGWRIPERVATVHAIGLKQFRDVRDGKLASFQSLIESPLTVTRLKDLRLLTTPFDFVLHSLASHPVTDSLGIKLGAQPVVASAYLRGEIEMGAGTTVWDAEVSPPVDVLDPKRLPKDPATGKVRIAILGGGIGSLATAFELTREAGWRSKYEITVYQQGFRLGGKGASGRNPAFGNRIEEHGLHVWFGFYDNAFKMIRECYEALGRPKDHPLATFEQAFLPHHEITVNESLAQFQLDEWSRWPLRLPPNGMTPGDDTKLPLFLSCVEFVLRAIAPALTDIITELNDTAVKVGVATSALERLVATFGGFVLDGLNPTDLDPRGVLDVLMRYVARPIESLSQQAVLEVVAELLGVFNDWFWSASVARFTEDTGRARKLAFVVDTLAAVVRGVLHERLYRYSLSVIDDVDFRVWLGRNGAHDETLHASPTVRFIYNAAFAFEQGEPARASFAAGAALRGVIRLICTYKGAILYRMSAGMGDVVFAPMLQVLEARGVKFEFFHRVDGLELTRDRRSIGRVRMTRQAAPALASYDPLVTINGLECWPSAPKWSLLVNGANLAQQQVDFDDPNGVIPGETKLSLELGRDFEAVVLGIPVAALKRIAAPLMACDRRWQAMVDRVQTVATQAFQVWMTPTLQETGWTQGPDMTECPVVGTYIEPMDTYCDMTHVLPRESWEKGTVGSVGYFCGVISEDEVTEVLRAPDRARANAIQYLTRDARYLWPRLYDASGAFDWSCLVDTSDASGERRFDAMYWRANVYPSERYTLSLPGTIKYRLRAEQSGFVNLALAGDWVDNGFNSGCVEATVMSGMQAARALTGREIEVVGESDSWLWR